ncbi:ABC transporter ATP-binding protein [Arthrobacter psychrochitiniphilus]|uniref:ABC transporter n=1 Tax=Arthrobacter psychrochitiniphilus TaxID=291045 RepID=A0A2V3DUM5_9MICC|nr:sulfonate transport system ATP-binding protein [Arthrobacter psychrochitiniphilus]PXA66029.1 ABC transporter [Arthrobacter psychrochitiniphilus]
MSTTLASAQPTAAPLPKPATTPRHTHAGTTAMGVSFRGLGRSFGEGTTSRTVLEDVTFTVRAGEIVAILGPSGCGKSTLLRAAAGLDSPTAGEVLIDGSVVSGIDPRCAFAFQEPRLMPWKSVTENVALGLPSGSAKRRRGVPSTVEDLLALVGLSEFAGHRPREISGGMAQRASLARALARNPGVLLLDEPFGALDALTRIKMQDLLLEIHTAEPTTVLLVTHDVDEALALADRIIVLGSDDSGTAKSSVHSGATIVRTVEVPGARPRSNASLAQLRSSLLASLGVSHH